MPGPSKINEAANIPRGAPNMTRLMMHADPTTGIGLACHYSVNFWPCFLVRHQ